MSVFETRQRARELLEEAIKIWRQSPQSESLEGLEKDPVMSLLMSAMAYYANETDSELERMRENILGEYVRALTPYELGHAIPATVVVEASPKGNVPEVMIDSGNRFKLANSQFDFIPVLRTKLIPANVHSITRIDGRRWKVNIQFGAPVRNLSGFAFALRNTYFKDLKVSYKGFYIPMLKPWDYSRLPLSSCFSMDAALYNGSQTYNPAMLGMELFSRQNVRIFCVREHDTTPYMPSAVEDMSLVFEFTGLSDRFVFDKKQLVLNSVILAEAQLGSVTLTTDNPVARVSGLSDGGGREKASSQFLQLVRPSDAQLYADERVEVRRVMGDRFNQGSLLRLLSSLINKFQTDFYAFQNKKELTDDGTIHTLQDILSRLINVCLNDKERNAEGVYLILHNAVATSTAKQYASLEINYLTTHGSAANDLLNEDAMFKPPADMDMDVCRQIAEPMPGKDEIGEKVCDESLMRYHIITNDRIVTPADIKAFCHNELMTRYGIDSSMVKGVSVGRRVNMEQTCGYEIAVEITLAANQFVKRSFSDKIPGVEQQLQKSMEVRATGIYPISVGIAIES